MSDQEFFGLEDMYSSMVEIEGCIAKVCYKFTSEEDFSKIDNIAELQLVYWSEMIQRLHISGATTILRLKKWYESLECAYKANNYYGFCASLRGLLEACSDSFHSIGKVLLPISKNFSHIKISISGDADKTVLSSPLEDELIHYMFGRKLSAAEKEKFEDSHKAKQVRQYLNSIQSDSLNDLYSELCQVSHPSSLSFIPFMMDHPEHGLMLHNGPVDEVLNENIMDRYKSTIYETMEFALWPALCSLKLVNMLGGSLLEALYTKDKAFEGLEKHDLWIRLENLIQAS
ncbi:MAG: hypothetical protein ACWA7D_00055 [Pseudomonas asiatica]